MWQKYHDFSKFLSFSTAYIQSIPHPPNGVIPYLKKELFCYVSQLVNFFRKLLTKSPHCVILIHRRRAKRPFGSLAKKSCGFYRKGEVIMTDIAKFLKKLRIDNEKNLGDMAEDLGLSAAYLSAIENGKRVAPEELKDLLFQKYRLSEDQKLEFAKLVAESRNKVEIGLAGIQEDILPEYVDTAVMFAHDLSQMNREQLAKVKDFLQEIKSRAAPM